MNITFDKINSGSGDSGPVIRSAFDKNFSLLRSKLLTVLPIVQSFEDASGGAVTYLLPDGALVDYAVYVVKTDSSGNAVTVTPYGTQTINGASSFVLAAQYNSVLLTYRAGVWYKIAVI